MATQIENTTQGGTSSKVVVYVNQQLEVARRQVKSTDLIGGILTIFAIALGFLLIAALWDGWIQPLSETGRWICFCILLTACAGYAALQIAPLLLKKINPDYAARMIEQAKPGFKNSLLNYLALRKRSDEVNPAVFQAVSRQAAENLKNVPADATVDRSKLIFMGFVLIGLMVFTVAYKMLSPKDPLQSFARVLIPSARISHPARVTITEIKPGDSKVFFGDQVEVTVVIRGNHHPDDVHLIVSTSDRQLKGQRIPMEAESLPNRYRAVLGKNGAGLQQSLTYQVAALDGISPSYEITVQPNPTIAIETLTFHPPKYTKQPVQTQVGQGEVNVLEGTRVVAEAIANLPIREAHLDLLQSIDDQSGGDNQQVRFRTIESIAMDVDGRKAKANFWALLNRAREQSWASHYQIRFVSTEGDRNQRPNIYPIKVTPDLAPEIRVNHPRSTEVSLPADGSLAIDFEANDLDFEISEVLFYLNHRGHLLVQERMQLQPVNGSQRVRGRYLLQPQQLRLQAGDTVMFFLTAADNRTVPADENQADPNISRSENFTVTIAQPTGQPAEQQPDPKSETDQKQPPQQQTADDQKQHPDQGDPQDQTSNQTDRSQEDSDQQSGAEKNQSGGSAKGENQGDRSENSDMENNKSSDGSDSNQNDADQNQAGEKQGESGSDQGMESQKNESGGGESGDSQNTESSGDQNTGSESSGRDQPDGQSSSGSQSGSKASQSQASEQGRGSDSTGDSSSRSNQSTNQQSDRSSGSTGNPERPQDSSSLPENADGTAESNESRDNELNSGNRKPLGKDASQGEQMRRLEQILNEQGEQKEEEEPNKSESEDQSDDRSDSKSPNDRNSKDGAAEPSGERGDRDQNSGMDPAERNDRGDPDRDSSGDQTDRKQGTGKEGSSQSSDPNGSDKDSGEPKSGGQSSGNQSQKSDDPSTPNQDQKSSSLGSDSNDRQQDGETASEGQRGDRKDAGTQNNKTSDNNQKSEDQSTGKESGESQMEPPGDESGNQSRAENKPNDGAADAPPKSEGSSAEQSPDQLSGSEQNSEQNGEQKSDSQQQGNQKSGDPQLNEKQSAQGKPDNQQTKSQPSGNQSSSKDKQSENAEMGEGQSKEDQAGQPSSDSETSEGEPSGSSENRGNSTSGSQQASDDSDGEPSSAEAPESSEGRSNSKSRTSSSPGGQGSGESFDLERDEVNLDHAKKATDLILKRLNDQKYSPDPSLLDEMNWTQEDLNQFLQRWQEMKQAADKGDQRDKRRYEQMLRSLDFRANSEKRTVRQSQEVIEGLNQDSAVIQPPPEFAPDFNATLRDLNRND